jgi:teichuronic acid biosynthesis glycosyltransferase TuaC
MLRTPVISSGGSVNASDVVGRCEFRDLSHIGFIAGAYPSSSQPYAGMFLERLVHTRASHGLRCSVIAPTSLQRWLVDAVAVHRGVEFSPVQHDLVNVSRPLYMSLAGAYFGLLQCPRLSQVLFQLAAMRAVRGLDRVPDAFYGHFLYPAGGAAVWLGRLLHRPSFVVMGEGSFWTLRDLGHDRAKADFANATGLIAVSSLLKKMLVAELNIPPEKIAVIPNGVERGVFYPRPRDEMRAKWKFPKDAFLVAFVGNYDYEKGGRRVTEAIDGLDNVFGIFAGSGPLPPQGKNVLFQNRVPHDLLPELLSAADAFVLPTTYEGSCNAIVEAMACGLPIVTSIGEFNDDLVDDEMAMRIDPLNVAAIRNAVIALRDDVEMRRRLSQESILRSQKFDLDARARKIEDWMNERGQMASREMLTSQSTTRGK